ncbi:MAG: GSCFA domain-containing protein [Hyphomicrobiales bacterium]
MQSLSCQEARQQQKRNPFATWSARSPAANANACFAVNRLKSDVPELSITPAFQIGRSEPIFAIGSCFAREVELALLKTGFEVPSRDERLFEHPLLAQAASQKANGSAVFALGYLNRYNTMSLHDELANLLGCDPAVAGGALIYSISETAAADLHYSQSLKQVDRKQSLERRQLVREHFGKAIRRCSVFVVTLGLAEAWYDMDAQRYLNNTPGPRVMEAHGERFQIRLTGFDENFQALEATHALLARELGSNFKMVITVSPVPLETTFFPDDIIAINSYSKSMLRAAAQQFAVRHVNVGYFPSYEMVQYSNPETAWAWDRRHVKPHVVEHIMSVFGDTYAGA